MSAPTGGRPKVIGSSMAMVASEPMPGSTPISVPTSRTDQAKQDVGRRRRHAEAQPEIGKKFIHGASRRSAETRPKLERQVQAVREQERAEGGQHGRPEQGFSSSACPRPPRRR